MWVLPWAEGMYRLENQMAKKEQLDKADREQARMLRKFLADIECQWCKEHHEPVVNAQGMCAYCEDRLYG